MLSRGVRVLLVAACAACGPITMPVTIHSERTTTIHTTIIKCENPEDEATCHEVHEPAPAPSEAP